jgi:DNA-binding response OmpR family regulator
MGFTLDSNTILELAAAIAAEVVQVMRAARVPTAVSDDVEVVQVGPLTVDLGRREAAANGRVLDLKPRELELLAALARNAGRALNRAQLLERAWDDATLDRIESERTVDVHVRRLRVQLGENAGMLHTVAWVGYRLDPP